MMKNRKSILWFLGMTLVATLSLSACSDDDNNEPGDGNKPGQEEVTTYDDLDYFQNAIVEIDSVGDMVCRTIGEVLDDSDPLHIYIGVNDLTEAETMFRGWIAPDIELSTTIPTTNGLTCQFTDEKGKAQGTVYFTPGTGTTVAEVTASNDMQLKHFNRITFLLNSAWPTNESVYQKYTEGDIVTYTPPYVGTAGLDVHMDMLDAKDKTLKWVCIRQAAKGVKPMFCAITNAVYESDDVPTRLIRESQYCPAEGTAQNICKILRASWDFYVERFNAAGCGKLTKDGQYWIDKTHWDWATYYDYMVYSSGKVDGAKYNVDKPFLLKIDWLDDSAISNALAGTDGCAGHEYEGYIRLFDGQQKTKWCSYKDWRKKSINGKDDVWFVEFQANAPVWPTGYKLTTANDAEKYNGRNPKTWKLYGKPNSDDDWELLSEVSNGGMGNVNCKTYSYTIAEPSYYMYFRLEISANGGDGHLQLSEISLVTINPDEDE